MSKSRINGQTGITVHSGEVEIMLRSDCRRSWRGS